MSEEEQRLAELRRQIRDGIERVRRSIERAKWMLSRAVASTTDVVARGSLPAAPKHEQSKKPA
jgi:hypothetical protein